MINTLKLRALLVQKNLTTKDVSKILKISQQSFSMKLNNKREFKASELYSLCSLLEITNIEDIMNIFFVGFVELNSTSC